MIIRSNGEKGLLALKSPDGLRFTPMSDRVVISEGAFDSQNLAFWDPVRREYRAYFPRVPAEGQGHPDGHFFRFPHLDGPGLVRSIPGAPTEHLYTNQLRPYHRAAPHPGGLSHALQGSGPHRSDLAPAGPGSSGAPGEGLPTLRDGRERRSPDDGPGPAPLQALGRGLHSTRARPDRQLGLRGQLHRLGNRPDPLRPARFSR